MRANADGDAGRLPALASGLVAAQVDLIISGDEDLLVLQSFEEMPILSPAQALEIISKE